LQFPCRRVSAPGRIDGGDRRFRANDKVRKLYASLTGDEIQEQPFWGSFLRSARRRDNIVRKGLIVGRTDAEESIAAADDFLAHLTG
jgi:hypothetical protein